MGPLLPLLLGCCSAAASGAKELRGRYVTVRAGGGTQCVVTNFGAKGDGKTDDTKAIQAAFDHCGQSGGGTVVVPAPKTYLMFSVHFTSSNQELHIEEGATLLGSDDIKSWDGGKVGSALIVAKPTTKGQKTLEHVAITGGVSLPSPRKQAAAAKQTAQGGTPSR